MDEYRELPEGLHYDPTHKQVKDAQDVVWVTLTDGGWGDPQEWRHEIERLVVEGLGLEMS